MTDPLIPDLDSEPAGDERFPVVLDLRGLLIPHKRLLKQEQHHAGQGQKDSQQGAGNH